MFDLNREILEREKAGLYTEFQNKNATIILMHNKVLSTLGCIAFYD